MKDGNKVFREKERGLSCRQNSGQATLSAASTGLSRTGSRLVYTAGAYLARMNDISVRGLGAAALLTGVAGPAARPGLRPRLREKAAAAGGQALLKAAALADPATRTATKVVKVTEAVSGALGSGAAMLTKTAEAGEVMRHKRKLLFFKSREPVALWQSGLTPLLNRRDLLVGTQQVQASEGTMFKIKGTTWHHGTVKVRTATGSRTMTHLQSLKLPAVHYFFERALTAGQAVEIAAGTTDPRTGPGYAGQVSAAESLAPAWAQAKQSLIKAYLHHSLTREENH
jgi:hypothetical protein